MRLLVENNVLKINVINGFYPGGVICFWGGIVLLGFLFMFVLVAKNYLMRHFSSRKFDE